MNDLEKEKTKNSMKEQTKKESNLRSLISKDVNDETIEMFIYPVNNGFFIVASDSKDFSYELNFCIQKDGSLIFAEYRDSNFDRSIFDKEKQYDNLYDSDYASMFLEIHKENILSRIKKGKFNNKDILTFITTERSRCCVAIEEINKSFLSEIEKIQQERDEKIEKLIEFSFSKMVYKCEQLLHRKNSSITKMSSF